MFTRAPFVCPPSGLKVIITFGGRVRGDSGAGRCETYGAASRHGQPAVQNPECVLETNKSEYELRNTKHKSFAPFRMLLLCSSRAQRRQKGDFTIFFLLQECIIYFYVFLVYYCLIMT